MQANHLQKQNAEEQRPYHKLNQPKSTTYTHNHYGLPPQPNRFEEFASELNQLKNQKFSYHWQALIATLILLAGETTGLVLFFLTDSLSLGGVLGVCIGSYILYLMIAFGNNSLPKYLSNINRGQTFEDEYESLRNAVGYFDVRAECYHYQTVHHTRVIRDQNGNNRYQHYSNTQKVITHSATQTLSPAVIRDESGAIDQIRASTTIVFIHYFVNYRFEDPLSQMNFDNFYNNFKLRHTKDTNQDFSFKFNVPGLIERKTYFIGELKCNYKLWYYVLGCLGLVWPYSLWVQSQISRFRVDIMKVLTL